MKTEKSLFFKVHADAKSVIGKDLINNDNIAILELVKNAYDANSPHVNITFLETCSTDNNASSIIVEDLGQGMSLDDIREKWLNIAYSEKKTGTSPQGRRVAGNKGVGRFSCDRLGKVLDLYTLKAGGEIIWLRIFWEQFEGKNHETQINNIPIQHAVVSLREFHLATGIKTFPHGTVLKITGLRAVWTEQKLLSLKRELERFANPHQDIMLNAFAIKLACPDYLASDLNKKQHEKINGHISNTIIGDISDQTSSIEASIDKRGESITTSLNHRGQHLFTVVEKNTFPNLKDINIKVLFLGPKDKALFTRRIGYQSVKFGSIFLFLHGFRISPYGEPTNDWLGIDQRKQQKYASSLGTREVLGQIEINAEDGDSWRIVSNREGLVQTPAYHELVSSDPSGFFWRVFRKLQRYVVEGIGWDSVSEDITELENKILHSSNPEAVKVEYSQSEEGKEAALIALLKGIITAGGTLLKNVQLIEFDPALALMLKKQKDEQVLAFFSEFGALAGRGEMSVDYIANLQKLKDLMADEVIAAKKLQQERDEARLEAEVAKNAARAAEKAASQAKAIAEQAVAAAEQKKRENLFLKATSNQDVTDVVNMHHQVLAWSTAIEKGCSRAIKLLAKGGQEKTIGEILNRISKQNRRIAKTATFVTKKNLKLNAEPRLGDVISFISDYLNELKVWKLFTKIDIVCELSSNFTFDTLFKPLEVTILLDNLISNSQKAQAKHFYVTICSLAKDSLALKFDDDGNGLDKKITDHSVIFDRGFTTTDGSGIGLNHCMDIVEEMKGTLALAPSNHNGLALIWSIPVIR